MAENACKGPENGPARTLNRSTFGAKRLAASAAESLPSGEGFREGVTWTDGVPPPVRNNYRTNYDDYLEVYLFGIRIDTWAPLWAGF